uniref:Adrenoceptor beta 3a n=1 Tax=Eptatretus burgeri TaxID=7764 RepID=A0A8C4PXH3_EPTBU
MPPTPRSTNGTVGSTDLSDACHADKSPWLPALGALIAVFVLCAVLGNLLIIAAVARVRRLRTPTNYLVASLACADLLMSILVVPFAAVPLFLKWPFGQGACKLWTAADIMCVTASIGTLCLIAVERYVAVTRPLRYQAVLTKARVCLLVVSVWLVAALISFIPVGTGWWQDQRQPEELGNCSSRECLFNINATYAVVSSAVSFYLPLFAMIFFYSKVFREAQQQVMKIERCELRNAERPAEDGDEGSSQNKGSAPPRLSRHEHRALKTLGLIMGVFTVCWLPFFIINIIDPFCKCVPQTILVLFNWFGYANSAFNPIIYCRSEDFRAAFRRLLCPWQFSDSWADRWPTRKLLSGTMANKHLEKVTRKTSVANN